MPYHAMSSSEAVPPTPVFHHICTILIPNFQKPWLSSIPHVVPLSSEAVSSVMAFCHAISPCLANPGVLRQFHQPNQQYWLSIMPYPWVLRLGMVTKARLVQLSPELWGRCRTWKLWAGKMAWDSPPELWIGTCIGHGGKPMLVKWPAELVERQCW